MTAIVTASWSAKATFLCMSKIRVVAATGTVAAGAASAMPDCAVCAVAALSLLPLQLHLLLEELADHGLRRAVVLRFAIATRCRVCARPSHAV